MSISILDHQLTEETYNRYDLTFFDIQIPILLTYSPPMVDQWIADLSVSRPQPQPLLIGLDVEWRPNFSNTDHPVATIQLCAAGQRGPTCLIFQILHSPHVPQSLIDFLGDTSNTFVGVGIDEDVEKLLCDYSLRVAKTVDLRDMAPTAMNKAGLKTMAKELLGKDVQKPKSISRSRWDYLWLTTAQVQYACLDAFLSFEIGRRLSDKPPQVEGCLDDTRVTATIDSIPMLSGTNFKTWKEEVMLVLALMNLDLSLQTDQPSDESCLEAKENFEQWERSDRLSLMIMKQKIPQHYMHLLSEQEMSNAKSLLAAADKYFAKSEKAEISCLLSNLVSMRYQGNGNNVRQHIMEMASLASKLNALKLDVSEDMLVNLVLISLPPQFGRIQVAHNSQIDNKWSLNDLISHCIHEEERLNQESVGSASRTKVCFICKNSGHVKRDCPMYHAKRSQKGLPERKPDEAKRVQCQINRLE